MFIHSTNCKIIESCGFLCHIMTTILYCLVIQKNRHIINHLHSSSKNCIYLTPSNTYREGDYEIMKLEQDKP